MVSKILFMPCEMSQGFNTHTGYTSYRRRVAKYLRLATGVFGIIAALFAMSVVYLATSIEVFSIILGISANLMGMSLLLIGVFTSQNK